MQEEGFPTLGTERSAEWRGRSAAEVCTSEARKIGVPLVARQGRSPSASLVSLHQREAVPACRGGRCGRLLTSPLAQEYIYVELLDVELRGIVKVMSEERPEFPKGTLDMLILKIVALGPIHGYAISQRIQQISKDVFQLTQGSLYPALHRLEDRGWLRANWKDTDTGRQAKFYTLTRKGQQQLEAEVLNWKRLNEAVSLILRTAE